MKNHHVKYGQLDTRELSDASKEKMAQQSVFLLKEIMCFNVSSSTFHCCIFHC